MSNRARTLWAYIGIIETIVVVTTMVMVSLSNASASFDSTQGIISVGFALVHGALFIFCSFLVLIVTLANDFSHTTASVRSAFWIWTAIVEAALFAISVHFITVNDLRSTLLALGSWLLGMAAGFLLLNRIGHRLYHNSLQDVQRLEAERQQKWPSWRVAIDRELNERLRATQGTTSIIPDHSWDWASVKYISESQQSDLEYQNRILVYRRANLLIRWRDQWNAMYSGESHTESSILRDSLEQLAMSTSQLLELELSSISTQFDLSTGTFQLDTRRAFSNTRLPDQLSVILLLDRPTSEIYYRFCDLCVQASGISRIALLITSDSVSTELDRLDFREKMRAYACDVVIATRSDIWQVLVDNQPSDTLLRLLVSQIDPRRLSPYETKGGTSSSMFFGREIEMRELTDHLGSTSYALVAGRRYGKTSILNYLYNNRLPAAGYSAIYHDCSWTPTYQTLLVELSKATLISEHRSFDTGDQQHQPAFATPVDPNSDHPTSLVSLIQSRQGGRGLVLLLDEADKLIPDDREHGWRLFSELRHLSSSRLAQVVIAGERVLHAAIHDPQSPLFNFGNVLLLGPLDISAVRELVTMPMRKILIDFADETGAVDKIYRVTGGHPSVVQLLCARIIKLLNKESDRQISDAHIDRVISEFDFVRNDLLSAYLDAATSLEKLICILMIADSRVRSSKAIRDTLSTRCGLQLPVSSIDDALRRLIELRCLLHASPRGYEFSTPSFPSVVLPALNPDELIERYLEELGASPI
ncbi:MAG: hypothetical protein IPJ58_07225 [Ardenticatenia bacterium]|nr:hypothetical protein [Ardenticatenia bacterium]